MAEIKIRLEELNNPRVDAIIEMERSISNNSNKSEFIENVKTPIYFNPAFYYAIATCLGSLIIWGITKSFYKDEDSPNAMIPIISDYLLFGPVAGVLSMVIGITYGISNRNIKQSIIYGITGLGIGLGITIFTTFIAEILYGSSILLVKTMITIEPGVEPEIKGAAFFVLMCGRGIGWAVVSCGAGLSLGIILKSKKMILNGLAGGIVGGALGGLMFDPISRFVTGNMEDGSLSRAVGIFFVGTLTGLFIGIFENASKESWLLMLKGPLAGKQFVIFKSPIFLGSAPKCEIYLFKDPHIEPKHANITVLGKKYLLEDLNSTGGTYVNGRKITNKYVLQPEDIITLGETVLKYQEKQKK